VAYLYCAIHTALIIETNSLAAELAFLAKAVLSTNINSSLGFVTCIMTLLSRRQCRLLGVSMWKATCVREVREEENEQISKDTFEILLAMFSKSGVTKTALYVFKTKIINDVNTK
jgi:hypothetical protein